MAAPVSTTDPLFVTKAFWDAENYARWVDLYSAWTTYTPTWTGATTNPVLGNGSLTGAYKVLDTGKSVYLRIRLLAGSTTTFGSGGWSFSLPAAVTALGATQCIGGYVLDNSALLRWPVAGIMTSLGIERVAVNSGIGVQAATPMTWATSDQLLLTGVYEIS